jgi:hypothetical protein
MGIIKLPNAGDEHVMTITECVQATGNFGEQVKFTDGTDILYLPQTSADQQLKRIFGEGFAYIDCVGNALKFSRTANTKRPGASPYWNIEPATAADKQSKRLPAPTTEVVGARATDVATNVAARATATGAHTASEIERAYSELWDRMAQRVALSCASHGIAPTADAVQAATATLWIAMKNAGISPIASTQTRTANDAPAVKMPTPSGKRLSPPPAIPDELPPAPHDDDLPF